MGDEFCSCDIVHENVIEMVKKKMPQEEKLYDLAELFKVFGDTTRVKIISALFEAEMCVCDIAELLHMTPVCHLSSTSCFASSTTCQASKRGKSRFLFTR
jgi:DNA-binding transcriptional ArsR family regulator